MVYVVSMSAGLNPNVLCGIKYCYTCHSFLYTLNLKTDKEVFIWCCCTYHMNKAQGGIIFTALIISTWHMGEYLLIHITLNTNNQDQFTSTCSLAELSVSWANGPNFVYGHTHTLSEDNLWQNRLLKGKTMH